MLEGIELIHRGDPGQAVLLPDGVITLDQIQHLRFEHEETAIDPGAVSPGFFIERQHPTPFEGKGSKAARGLHSGERGPASLGAMKSKGGTDIHIGYAISIGGAEGLAMLQIGLYALEAPACKGCGSYIH